jgi:metal-dependent amidase/aminoacylase/carboxypeptidase family protein
MGTTGILAIYKGKEEGKTVLFRCELDALPIDEINTFDMKWHENAQRHDNFLSRQMMTIKHPI